MPSLVSPTVPTFFFLPLSVELSEGGGEGTLLRLVPPFVLFCSGHSLRLCGRSACRGCELKRPTYMSIAAGRWGKCGCVQMAPRLPFLTSAAFWGTHKRGVEREKLYLQSAWLLFLFYLSWVVALASTCVQTLINVMGAANESLCFICFAWGASEVMFKWLPRSSGLWCTGVSYRRHAELWLRSVLCHKNERLDIFSWRRLLHHGALLETCQPSACLIKNVAADHYLWLIV